MYFKRLDAPCKVERAGHLALTIWTTEPIHPGNRLGLPRVHIPFGIRPRVVRIVNRIKNLFEMEVLCVGGGSGGANRRYLKIDTRAPSRLKSNGNDNKRESYSKKRTGARNPFGEWPPSERHSLNPGK